MSKTQEFTPTKQEALVMSEYELEQIYSWVD